FVDDGDVGRCIAERAVDLERRCEVRRAYAVETFEDADLDVCVGVDPGPPRAELSDLATARNQESDVMTVPRECDREQRVGGTGAAGACPPEQLAGDDRDSPRCHRPTTRRTARLSAL